MLEPKGFFVANKYKFFSITQYTILVYKDRLIFLRTGGQFSDYHGATLGGAALGGLVGAGIGLAVDAWNARPKGGKLENKAEQLSEMTEDDVLAANKANFILNIDEISSLKIKKAYYNWYYRQYRSGEVNIRLNNGKKLLLDLSRHIKYDATLALLQQAMPDKLQPGKK
jgi:hypothetical protein